MSLNSDIQLIFNSYKGKVKNPRFIIENSSSSIPVNAGVSQEEINQMQQTNDLSSALWSKFADRIAGAKLNLRRTYPFYFYVLDRLKLVPTMKIPTMAVDDYNNIYINPIFAIFELSLNECSGVLAHEASHIFRKHFFRLGNRDRQLWNYATDYNINMILTRDGHELPKAGCIPFNNSGRWYVSAQDFLKMDPTYQGGDLDITDLAAEEIYSYMLKNIKATPSGGGEGGEGEGGEGGEGRGGEGKPGRGRDGGGGGGGGGSEGNIKTLDEHITDGRGPEAAKVEGQELPDKYKPRDSQDAKDHSEAHAENLTREAIKDAQKRANLGNQNRGTGSGIPRELQIDIEQPSVDWKNVLRQFLTLGGKIKRDWGRPRKKAMAAGYYAPRTQQIQNNLDAVITIDTSGSISDDSIKAFVSEIIAIIRTAPYIRALLIFWSDEAYSPDPSGKPFFIEGKVTSIMDATKKLSNLNIMSGGTSMSSITPYYENAKKQVLGFDPTVMITFTDGFIEDVPRLPADIPFNNRIFLINNLGGRSQSVFSGDDSIVKKLGKYIFSVKVNS